MSTVYLIWSYLKLSLSSLTGTIEWKLEDDIRGIIKDN